jgi:hypothetical protein
MQQILCPGTGAGNLSKRGHCQCNSGRRLNSGHRNDEKIAVWNQNWQDNHTLASHPNLQRIQRHMLTLFSIDFRWVRRNANALADRLANEGVHQDGNGLDVAWTQVQVGQLREDCEQLAKKIIMAVIKKTST